ncbi:porin [Paraburkholderia sp. A3BS-1L]|uniref:porin n=1 Tax=Paraburkholderia sp. A3BS-1L TaxID=3028375 RepID=UPI003DAA0353
MTATPCKAFVRLRTGFILTFGLLALHAPAQAQGSITLYGILSEGLAWASNEGGHANLKLVSGTNQNSRFGLRGMEDLGGGVKAIFTLENGFDITTGKFQQGGRMFGRQAYVGLSSERFGTLTAGRQYDTAYDYLAPFESAIAATGLAVHPGDNDDVFGSYRYNNSLKYQSPTVGGLRAQVMYAMSNAAGQWALNRSVSSGVAYEASQFRLAAIYLQNDRPGAGANPSGALTDDYAGAPFLLFHSSPLDPSVGVRRQREFGAGAQYTAGKLRVSGLVTDVRYDYLDTTSLHLVNVDVSASYSVTPSLLLSTGYVYTAGRYGGYNRAPHWNNIQAGADYFLSKRTDIYLFCDYQRASGANADVYMFSPSSSASQTVVVAGLRHKF